jgi:hypothetical protein
VIDEPGSFLHPGASRVLINIFRRFAQHQYIIATHSPEIISELSDCPVKIVRWQNSESVVEQAERTTGKLTSVALSEVGARLSDVFGFDSVLWVEGPSDAASLKIMISAMQKSLRRTEILPVRDTGAFRRRSIGEILDIYRRLAMGDALLPPAVLFLFDRDDRTSTEIKDAIREGGGKLRFLDRRMFENYLLNPAAITQVFNESSAEFGLATTEVIVRNWISQRGREFCGGPAVVTTWSDAWFDSVHGAALLQGIFADLSEARIVYRKIVHTPKLSAALCEVDPDAAERVLELVRDVIV